MSLLHIDSLEGYDEDTIVLNGGKYENWIHDGNNGDEILIAANYGRNGSSGFRFITNSYTSGQRGSVTRHLNGNYDTIIVGAAVKINNLGQLSIEKDQTPYHWTIFSLLDGDEIQASLTITPSMRLSLTQGGGGSGDPENEIARSSFSLHAGVYYYLEMKLLVSNTAGSCEVRVDGISRLTASGDTQATDNQWINGVRFGYGAFYPWTNQGRRIQFDDIYIANTNGGTYNDFVGDVRVEGIRPVGDQPTHQWTPSSGTVHFETIDDSTPDITNYVTSDTTGDIDLFSVGNITTPSANILAISPNIYARKSNAGVARVVALVNRAGSTDVGIDNYLTQEYRYHYSDIWTTNPINSSAWGNSLSGYYFGVKKSG